MEIITEVGIFVYYKKEIRNTITLVMILLGDDQLGDLWEECGECQRENMKCKRCYKSKDKIPTMFVPKAQSSGARSYRNNRYGDDYQ